MSLFMLLLKKTVLEGCAFSIAAYLYVNTNIIKHHLEHSKNDFLCFKCITV